MRDSRLHTSAQRQGAVAVCEYSICVCAVVLTSCKSTMIVCLLVKCIEMLELRQFWRSGMIIIAGFQAVYRVFKYMMDKRSRQTSTLSLITVEKMLIFI